MFKWAKRRYIVGCKHRFKTLVCSVEMPYIMCQKRCLHPVLVLEIKSRILNPVTLKKNVLWLQMNHDPRELSIFIHIQNIPTQGSLILTYPAFWSLNVCCRLPRDQRVPPTNICHLLYASVLSSSSPPAQRTNPPPCCVSPICDAVLPGRKLNDTCPYHSRNA